LIIRFEIEINSYYGIVSFAVIQVRNQDCIMCNM